MMIHLPTKLLTHLSFRIYGILVCCLCSLTVAAQTDATLRQESQSETELPADSMTVRDTPYTMTGIGFQPEMTGLATTFRPTAYGIHGYAPYYDGALDTGWELHQGFNAQFSMGMTCGFGKNRIKGVGFGQTAAFAYVQPVTPKFSIAGGIYATNFDWGPWHTTDVGISGVLADQLTDRLSVYAFGSKSFIPKQNNLRTHSLSVPMYWMRPNNRFGAAAEYKFSEHFKMGISVERVEY